MSPLLVALNVCLRLYSAAYMIISDCDESFNYWEPLNLLLRGFGKETWEYSPEFAIRSYSYLVPYWLVAKPFAQWLSSVTLFYFIRVVVLCGFTAYAEYSLYKALKKSCTRTSIAPDTYYIFTSLATGMSHAGVALLPSSFAMNCVTMATASALSDSPVAALLWFVSSGVLGWPFALVLAVPYGLQVVLKSRFARTAQIALKVAVFALCLLAVVVAIDYYFYKFIAFIPVNIVAYNVFGSAGEGPDIFGTEPWTYYPLNLVLNFNIVFFLGYLGALINIDTPALNFPLILWSTIFFKQPHKEERFMYPVYPFICANALIFVDKLSLQVTLSRLRIFIVYSVVAAFTAVSVLRTLNLVDKYLAPLTTLRYFEDNYIDSSIGGKDFQQNINVCIGREWYHFPTSMFLPANYRLRFAQSGFDGLLPRDFNETLGSVAAATSYWPSDMNNKNQFSPSTVVDISECDYFVDNDGPLSASDYFLFNDPQWETVACEKLINPDQKQRLTLSKFVYLPPFLRIDGDVDYFNFCVLKRRTAEEIV